MRQGLQILVWRRASYATARHAAPRPWNVKAKETRQRGRPRASEIARSVKRSSGSDGTVSAAADRLSGRAIFPPACGWLCPANDRRKSAKHPPAPRHDRLKPRSASGRARQPPRPPMARFPQCAEHALSADIGPRKHVGHPSPRDSAGLLPAGCICGPAVDARPARDRGDCSMCSRSAARVKWSYSATARKQRTCRNSIIPARLQGCFTLTITFPFERPFST